MNNKENKKEINRTQAPKRRDRAAAELGTLLKKKYALEVEMLETISKQIALAESRRKEVRS